MKLCSRRKCDRKHYARGLCRLHYDRLWWANGKHLEHELLTLEDRFWAKVQKTKTCWLWTGSTYKSGHGQIWNGKKLERAHRVSWRLKHGKIPKGMKVCHHCDVPGCVRPSHLFLGTQKDNMEDAARKGRIRNQNTGKTHCARGHKFDKLNTYVLPNGHRQCRKCRNRRQQKRRRSNA